MNNAIILALIIALIWCGEARAKPIEFYPSPRQQDWMTRVAAGEARGQSDMEIAGICHAALNRMRLGLWGDNLEAVVKAPRQFSPLNKEDRNRRLITATGFEQTHAYKRVDSICRLSIKGRLEGWMIDITAAADHFHSGPAPWWAKGQTPTAKIGAFTFYRLRNPVKSQARISARRIKSNGN